METAVALWRQCYPPAPTFTEADVPAGSQAGRVFMVTGASSGVALALCKQLYGTGATIYMAGRSAARLDAAMRDIRESAGSSPAPAHPATLRPLVLDLSDLATVAAAVAAFAAHETRLDVLWNIAGAGLPPGSLTPQGLEANVGTMCVGPFLLTQGLLPFLRAAAAAPVRSAGTGTGGGVGDSVRVVWTGSIQIEMGSPRGGVDLAAAGKPTTNQDMDYGAAKAGNWFLAAECARRWGRDGILSVCVNPGNLNTPIFDKENWLWVMFLKTFVLHPPKLGAYSMLFGGLSPAVDESRSGAYIWPWGRFDIPGRPDVVQAVAEGKKPQEFWEWCEKKCESYA